MTYCKKLSAVLRRGRGQCHCHPAARRRRKPGIQKHRPGLSIPGPREERPGMTRHFRLAATARIRSAVRSSAGKNVSSASSDNVTSTGVPKIMVVDIKLNISSPNRILNGIATLSVDNGAERAGIG